jgi:hypothetical protein
MRDASNAGIEITPEMISAGIAAYRDFLGDECPIITDERDLVSEIYSATEQTRMDKGCS